MRRWTVSFKCKFTYKRMFKNVNNDIRPNKTSFKFIPLTYQRAQNWPVLRSSISTFRDYHFIRVYYSYQSLKVSRRSFRRSYDEHSNLFWGEATGHDLTWWPKLTFSDLGLKFAHMPERCIKKCAKLYLCEKSQGVGVRILPNRLGLKRKNMCNHILQCLYNHSLQLRYGKTMRFPGNIIIGFWKKEQVRDIYK